MSAATNFVCSVSNTNGPGKVQFCSIEADKTLMKGVGIVDANDNTHYAYRRRRHHDRAVTGLWLISLHDGKRGTRQISQSASLLAPQRTLLG